MMLIYVVFVVVVVCVAWLCVVVFCGVWVLLYCCCRVMVWLLCCILYQSLPWCVDVLLFVSGVRLLCLLMLCVDNVVVVVLLSVFCACCLVLCVDLCCVLSVNYVVAAFGVVFDRFGGCFVKL